MGITKEEIVRVAKPLLLSEGVKVTKMSQIADELGVTEETLRSVYPQKGDLIKDAMDLFFEEFEQLTYSINSQNINAIEKWLSIITGITEVMQLANKESCVIQLKTYYPDIFVSAQVKQWEILKRTFQANIFQGMKEGLFRIDFDSDLFMRFYFLGLLDIEQSELLKETPYSYYQLKIRYLDHLIRSIATERGVEVLEQVLNL